MEFCPRALISNFSTEDSLVGIMSEIRGPAPMSYQDYEAYEEYEGEDEDRQSEDEYAELDDDS